jgi:hypothetical protein
MVTTPLLRQQGTEALNVCLEVVAGQCGPNVGAGRGGHSDVRRVHDLRPLPCESSLQRFRSPGQSLRTVSDLEVRYPLLSFAVRQAPPSCGPSAAHPAWLPDRPQRPGGSSTCWPTTIQPRHASASSSYAPSVPTRRTTSTVSRSCKERIRSAKPDCRSGRRRRTPPTTTGGSSRSTPAPCPSHPRPRARLAGGGRLPPPTRPHRRVSTWAPSSAWSRHDGAEPSTTSSRSTRQPTTPASCSRSNGAAGGCFSRAMQRSGAGRQWPKRRAQAGPPPQGLAPRQPQRHPHRRHLRGHPAGGSAEQPPTPRRHLNLGGHLLRHPAPTDEQPARRAGDRTLDPRPAGQAVLRGDLPRLNKPRASGTDRDG